FGFNPKTGREKTPKNQALTSVPVFWQNRACNTAEQGWQRGRGGCQLSPNRKSRRAKTGDVSIKATPTGLANPNRRLPRSLFAPSAVRQIRLASICPIRPLKLCRTDVIRPELLQLGYPT